MSHEQKSIIQENLASFSEQNKEYNMYVVQE